MTSYSDTLAYLYNLQYRGMKFGLRNTRSLLAAVGNPHLKFQSIHIAGTNGKGSTAAFIASIATEAGCKTALYTSPHLLRFTERIRIDGKEITKRRLVGYVQRLRPAIERVRATFFEATTCIAFQYFAEEEVDLAVVETGLGGRLDATNVLIPLVSVITNVSLEHREYLGNTVTAIAREKGGIIKPGIPCVTAAENKEVVEVLKGIASGKKTKLFQARSVTSIQEKECPGGVVNMNIDSRGLRIRNANLGLTGSHQIYNAQLAVATIEILFQHKHQLAKRMNSLSVKRGLQNVRANTGIRGRYETLGRNQRYILDVAHNPAGIRALVDALQQNGVRGLTVVFGVMKDKEYVPMIHELAKIARVFVVVSPNMPRAMKVRSLSNRMKKMGFATVRANSVSTGVQIGAALSGMGRKVLITGSHYVVSEALEALGRKKLDNIQ